MNESLSRAPDAHAGGAQAAPLSISDFRALSRSFRDLHALRNVSIAALNLSPIAWSLLLTIYHYLWGASEAWPTQARLVQYLGWCERTVRGRTRELEATGFLIVERRRRAAPLGGFKLFYLPGPALVEGLGMLAMRVRSRLGRPSDAALTLVQTSPVAPLAGGAGGGQTSSVDGSKKKAFEGRASGTARGSRPAGDADKLNPSEILSIPSLLRAVAEAPAEAWPTAPEAEAKGDLGMGDESAEASALGSRAVEPSPPASLDDAQVAAELLAHRQHLAHPHAALRVVPSGPGLALASDRVAELGDMPLAEKLRQGKLAVEAAHRRSLGKTGKSPSVGYVFGSEAYFRGHLERGLAEGRKRRGPPPNQGPHEGPQAPADEREAEGVGDPPPPRLQGQGEAARASQKGNESGPGEGAAMTLAELEAAALAASLTVGESSTPTRIGAARVVRSTGTPGARAGAARSDAPPSAEARARARAELYAGLSPEDAAHLARAEEIARQKRAEEARRTAG